MNVLHSLLTANGLGISKLHLFEESDATEIHEAIIDCYPQVKDLGYELLRTVSSSKKLEIIVAPVDGYTGLFLKNVLGQAKCYIRPILRDIIIYPVNSVSEVSSHVCFRWLFVLDIRMCTKDEM